MSDEINKKGLFIVFEGVDGCGKSTQARLLYEKLAAIFGAKSVYETEEPQQSSTGGLIRDVFNGKTRRSASEIAALFLCDRIDHNINAKYGIKRYLERVVTVISDRYYYSTFAYQREGENLNWLKSLNLCCSEIEKPDVCFFIDTPPTVCMERMKATRLFLDANEDKLSFIERTRANYLSAFETLADHNIVILDGEKGEEEIADTIFAEVQRLIER